ncbi:MAG: NMD3-related protein [Thermoplasmata archaeon]
MKSFCVECGKEGVVYRGLCERCLPKKKSLLVVPPILELHTCKHCGTYKLPGGWKQSSLEDGISSIASKAAELPRDILHHHLSLSYAYEDENRLQVRLSARLGLPGMTVTEERGIEVRLKTTTCPQCSRQQGEYYEAIIQARAQQRSLTEEEVGAVRQLISERVHRDPGLFITREERVHGGINVYLSSNRAAKSITRELRRRLGGRLSSSPQLHTRRKGKDVYRVTYLLRLPGLAEGDTIELRGRIYQVLSLGEPALVRDLLEGDNKTLGSQELLKAERLESRSVQGVLISGTEEEMQVMDSEGYDVHRVTRPPSLELEGDEVTLVITSKGVFIAPPQDVGRRAGSRSRRP